MADGASFTVSMVDKVSGPVDNAIKTLSELDSAIKKDERTLKALEAAMKRLSTRTDVSADRLRGLQRAIDNTKASILTNTNKMADMAANEKKAGDETAGLSGKTGAYVAAALAALAIVTKLAQAFYGYAKAAVQAALASANAYRTMRLNAEALTGSAAAGRAYVETAYAVAHSSALAEERVLEIAKSLQVANLGAGQFKTTLSALSTVASIAGDEAANKLLELAKKAQASGQLQLGEDLVGTGLSQADVYAQLAAKLGVGVDKVDALLKAGKVKAQVGIDALNAAVQTRFGDVAARKMLDFDVQISKAKDNLSAMFHDVAIEPFLVALQKALSVLDSSTVVGAKLQKILVAMMDGFFEAATKALPYAELMFLKLVNNALKWYIALRPAVKKLAELFGLDSGPAQDSLDEMGKSMDKMIKFANVIVAVVGTIGIATYIALWPWIKTAEAIYDVTVALADLFVWIGEVNTAMWDAILSWDWAALGGDIVAGIGEGIMAGVDKVVNACKSIAGAARSAFRGELKINSPSKVFADDAGSVPEGAVKGIEKGIPDVRAAVSRMIAVPVTFTEAQAAAAPRRGATAGGAGGMTIMPGAVVVSIQGGAGDDIEAVVRRTVTEAFESLALRMGALPA